MQPRRPGQRPLILLKGLIRLCSYLTHQWQLCRQQARCTITPRTAATPLLATPISGSPADIDKALPNQTVPISDKMRAVCTVLCDLAGTKGSPRNSWVSLADTTTSCAVSANMHTCSAAGSQLHLQCVYCAAHIEKLNLHGSHLLGIS